MASVYTISLYHGSGAVASVDNLFVKAIAVSEASGIYKDYYSASNPPTTSNSITNITTPTWKSGSKIFNGYVDEDGYKMISESGSIHFAMWGGGVTPSGKRVNSDAAWTAEWINACPTAILSNTGGTGSTSELYYNSSDSKWYVDFPFNTEFSSASPITVPTRACYEFLGYYSTSSSGGRQYIDADGKPTDEFLSLDPTEDITIYARWNLIAYAVTIYHSSAATSRTVFYAKIGESGTKTGEVWSGRFYSDPLCKIGINSITPPMRECFRWEGAWSTTWTQASAVQYVRSDGLFTDSLYSLQISGNKSITSANFWTQVSYPVTQYNSSGWTYLLSAYYVKKTDGGIYDDWLCPSGEELSTLPIPSKPGYRYIGSYSANNTSSTLCVSGSGVIQDYIKIRQAATTIYPQGRAASFTLTLDANGGSGGSYIYYDATSGDAAFFGESSSVVTSVTPPTYTGNSFIGYFTERSGGTQVIDAGGNILGSWTPSESATVYAQWGIEVSIVDVDAGEGATSGTSRFWYRMTTGKFYSDAEMTHEISSIDPPSKRLFDLNGIYTEENVLAVSSSGVIQPGFSPSDEFVHLHATYTRRCYEAVLSAGGGISLVSSVYRVPGGSTFFEDEALTIPISNVGVPIRTGYTFGGYKYGGDTVISTAGDILPAACVDDDYTADATWTAITYSLVFDGNGATPSFSSKSVRYGSVIGTLPTVSMSGRRFDAWTIDGSVIKATDVWTICDNKIAVARWKDYFGGLTDWFDMSGNLLMLVESESGEGRRVTNLWNGVFEQGPGILNPVCTYRIRFSGSLMIRLGKAFSNGYFITGFEYATGADKEPVLVVRGTANEGKDAINVYDVMLNVNPDHVAQDPYGAVSGGGELVDMTSGATCDPVVPYEDNIPCASDVVHGRKTVTGRTAAYFGEDRPTFLDSFIDSGVQKSESDVDFNTYEFTAERNIT